MAMLSEVLQCILYIPKLDLSFRDGVQKLFKSPFKKGKRMDFVSRKAKKSIPS